VGCLHGDVAELKPLARATLEDLLQAPEQDAQLAALGALAAMPHADLLPLVRPFLRSEQARLRAFALTIWSRCSHLALDEAVSMIDAALACPAYGVRVAAIRAAAHLSFADLPGLAWLSRALRDEDHRVRAAARACAAAFMPAHTRAWGAALAQHGRDFDLQQVMIPALAASDIRGKDELLDQQRDWHVRHARDALLIRDRIAASGKQAAPEWTFLMLVLREEALRHLDSVLQILGNTGQGAEISAIRAGLLSEDRHLWAQTMESALQHKRHGALFHELALLFEAAREGVALRGAAPGKQGFSDWLAWCETHGSDWLGESARHCRDLQKGMA
jgi:hypothetical protein